MFEGLSVAMVTPFRDGAIDLEATARLVEHMIEGGVQGLVVSGSTGEAATCSVEERRALWTFVKQQVKGRVWVVAGTGTNNTAESITLTRMAEEVGVDGAMVVTPYYNKPTAKGQIAHFSTVAKSTKLPVILYNVPGRTATNTLPEVLAQVQDVPNIVAVKEASGSIDQISQLRAKTRFTVLSGDDGMTLPVIAVGGEGIISVAGQGAPREMRALCDAARAGKKAEAEELHKKLQPLFKGIFVESNPGPIKAMLAELGLIRNELRLPLVTVEPSTEQLMRDLIAQLGLRVATAAARA